MAPTLGKSKCICVPTIFSVLQYISPYSSLISTPNFSKPFKCKSIGLDPMSHPPGYEKIFLSMLLQELQMNAFVSLNHLVSHMYVLY